MGNELIHDEELSSREHGKEYLLHRIMAGSAFVFALCILPVAQYILTEAQETYKTEVAETASTPRYGYVDTSSLPEEGEVAGVSTEDSTDGSVLSNILPEVSPTPEPRDRAECLAWQERDLADLKVFSEGKHASMQRDYEATVEPFRAALTVLSGEPAMVEQQRQELNAEIDKVYQPYLKELALVETAVSEEQKKIQERTCPAE